MTIAACLLAAVLLAPRPAPQSASAPVEAAGPFAEAILRAQPRVVKLFGAGLGALQGYSSGVLISSDGRILTTLEALLESEHARVVLGDGRRLPFTLLARDERRQLALLKVDAAGLPHFELDAGADPQPGDWVVAAANPFKVAVGGEPVSVIVGVVAARAPLAARRRSQEFAYEGEALIVDALIATPGSSGGALLDASGNLIGLIGKAAESTRTNTWLNYAVPADELAAFVREADQGRTSPSTVDWPPPAELSGPEMRARVAHLGVRFFGLGARRSPAYVERVRVGSAAEESGLRSGDLLLSIHQAPIATCEQAERLLASQPPGGAVELIVKRGQEVLTLMLRIPEAAP